MSNPLPLIPLIADPTKLLNIIREAKQRDYDHDVGEWDKVNLSMLETYDSRKHQYLAQPGADPTAFPPFRGLPLVDSPKDFTLHPLAFEFAPWGDRIVIVRDKAPTKKGSIFLADDAQELPTTGWVMSCGPGVDDYALGVRRSPFVGARLLGCKVLFGMYAGQVLNVGDTGMAEDGFRSRYTVLDIGSVWGTVGEPPSEVPL